MSEVIIRRAASSDTKGLIACIDLAYAEHRDMLAGFPNVSQGVAEDIADHTVFVAEINSRIAGGLILQINEDVGLLANVAVRPDVRGKGVGSALIETAEDYFRSKNMRLMKLTTHKEMPQNVDLYQRLGWKVSGEAGNKVYMEKPL